MVKLLYSEGGIYASSDYSEIPLNIAAVMGHEALVDYFADLYPKNHRYSFLGHALIHAVIQKNERMVAYLLSKGADVHVQSPKYHAYAALHCAVINQQFDFVELLVKHGARNANGIWVTPRDLAQKIFLYEDGKFCKLSRQFGEAPTSKLKDKARKIMEYLTAVFPIRSLSDIRKSEYTHSNSISSNPLVTTVVTTTKKSESNNNIQEEEIPQDTTIPEYLKTKFYDTDEVDQTVAKIEVKNAEFVRRRNGLIMPGQK